MQRLDRFIMLAEDYIEKETVTYWHSHTALSVLMYVLNDNIMATSLIYFKSHCDANKEHAWSTQFVHKD